MRLTLLLAFGLASSTAFGQAQPTYGCDSPESKQLDFWVGTWELSYKGADGQPTKSRNKITKVLDGCAVLEEFDGGGGTKLVGRSYSVYDRATQKWKQTWVDNSGSYLDLEGATVDGNFAFVRTATRNGKTSHQRMVFSEVKPDSLRWTWQVSPDAKTWNTAWDIEYRRIKP